MREIIYMLLFVLLMYMMLYNVKLLVDKTSKKIYETESEMDENDFVMKLESGDIVIGISWIGVWIGLVVVVLIGMRLANYRVRGVLILDIPLFLVYAIMFSFLPWRVWSILTSIRQRIIVKGNTITHYKSQRKVAEITFDEISKAKIGESKNRIYIKFFGVNDETIFTLYNNWIGRGVLLRRLILSGKVPLFQISPHLKSAPRKNEKAIKKGVNDLTALMSFLIEEDLTTSDSFNENGLVDINFELYYHDLTAKGQHLFTPNIIDKWFNPSPDDEEISEMSDYILLLKADLNQIRDR